MMLQVDHVISASFNEKKDLMEIVPMDPVDHIFSLLLDLFDADRDAVAGEVVDWNELAHEISTCGTTKKLLRFLAIKFV